jgi:acetamidase/formamidase
MGALAGIGPWFSKLAHAAATFDSGAATHDSGIPSAPRKDDEGRVHVVESNDKTVHLGVYDTTLDPIIKIDSGDTLSFPNTWSHFLNQMQPGVPLDTLVKIRLSNPGHGPHSIIGPIYVNGAEPGDVLEVRYKRIVPFDWGAVFNNPGTIGTGLLAQDFPDGQMKYLKLDLPNMTAEFNANIHVPLRPFQGTLGVAPPDGFYPPLTSGVTSSVPPGHMPAIPT